MELACITAEKAVLDQKATDIQPAIGIIPMLDVRRNYKNTPWGGVKTVRFDLVPPALPKDKV